MGSTRLKNISAQLARRKTWQFNRMNTISETLTPNHPSKTITSISRVRHKLHNRFKDSSLLHPKWSPPTPHSYNKMCGITWIRRVVAGRGVSSVSAYLVQIMREAYPPRCKKRPEMLLNRLIWRLILVARPAIKKLSRSQYHYQILNLASALSS